MQGIRHLVFGLRVKQELIWEFRRDKNDEIEIYKNPLRTKFLINSQMIYHNNHLFLIGGDNPINYKATDSCRKFKIEVNEATNLLSLTEEPNCAKLLNKRSMHSCFVMKDYLFVVFGIQSTVECIDLREQGAEFREIPIEEGEIQMAKVMIFITTNQEVLFFGGECLSGAKARG